MDLDRLYEILREATVQIRKGAVVHGSPELVTALQSGDHQGELPGGVVTIDLMPSEAEVAAGLEIVDLHFLKVGVDPAAAERLKPDLIAVLAGAPDWSNGPSYIQVGADIGDQGAAFALFALGKVLGLWSIITPAGLGMSGEAADRAAGAGYIMISGWRGRESADGE